MHRFCEESVLPILEPLFADEHLFLENMADIIQRQATGENLSDSQKLIFSKDEPFIELENQQASPSEIDFD